MYGWADGIGRAGNDSSGKSPAERAEQARRPGTWAAGWDGY